MRLRIKSLLLSFLQHINHLKVASPHLLHYQNRSKYDNLIHLLLPPWSMIQQFPALCFCAPISSPNSVELLSQSDQIKLHSTCERVKCIFGRAALAAPAFKLPVNSAAIRTKAQSKYSPLLHRRSFIFHPNHPSWDRAEIPQYPSTFHPKPQTEAYAEAVPGAPNNPSN